MGMFDDLKIKTEMLPITDEEMRLLGEDPGWQTKSLECVLSVAEITEKGTLKFRNMLSEKDDKASNTLGGEVSLTDEEIKWVELFDYHGFVDFYTHDKNNESWEFCAKFTDGKLVRLTGGRQTEV